MTCRGYGKIETLKWDDQRRRFYGKFSFKIEEGCPADNCKVSGSWSATGRVNGKTYPVQLTFNQTVPMKYVNAFFFEGVGDWFVEPVTKRPLPDGDLQKLEISDRKLQVDSCRTKVAETVLGGTDVKTLLEGMKPNTGSTKCDQKDAGASCVSGK